MENRTQGQLDTILESLRGEGKLDSHGRFTVDLRLALEKLRKRLLQPEDCLLYLLQSAVASGATFLNVQSTPNDVFITHDGFFPTLEEVPEMLEWALGCGDVPSLVARHRFGMALAAAIAPPGVGLEVLFPGGPAVWVRGDEIQVRQIETSKPPQIRIPVKRSWWRRIFCQGQSIVRRLRERGRYAPLDLVVDEVPGSGTEFGKAAVTESGWMSRHSLATILIGADEGNPIVFRDHHLLELQIPSRSIGCDWLALPIKSRATLSLSLFPAGTADAVPHALRGRQVRACSAALALCALPAPRVEVVQYGVSLTPIYLGERGDLWILLVDHRLTTDLSGLKPVVNEELRTRVRELQAKFAYLYDTVLQAHKSSRATDGWKVWLLRETDKARALVSAAGLKCE